MSFAIITLCTLAKIHSRRHIEIFFLIFPIFYWRQFARNVKPFFFFFGGGGGGGRGGGGRGGGVGEEAWGE